MECCAWALTATLLFHCTPDDNIIQQTAVKKQFTHSDCGILSSALNAKGGWLHSKSLETYNELNQDGCGTLPTETNGQGDRTQHLIYTVDAHKIISAQIRCMKQSKQQWHSCEIETHINFLIVLARTSSFRLHSFYTLAMPLHMHAEHSVHAPLASDYIHFTYLKCDCTCIAHAFWAFWTQTEVVRLKLTSVTNINTLCFECF